MKYLIRIGGKIDGPIFSRSSKSQKESMSKKLEILGGKFLKNENPQTEIDF
jgi:hypothetical protein